MKNKMSVKIKEISHGRKEKELIDRNNRDAYVFINTVWKPARLQYNLC